MSERVAVTEKLSCHHCGDSCPDQSIQIDDKFFCCEGCKMVYEILQEKDMCAYYDLEKHPGIKVKSNQRRERFAYLDHPDMERQLLDFQDEDISTVTFFLPQIHCASCIWLLEKLYLLRPEIRKSRVNFMRKTVHLTFAREEISLREVVEVLTSIGYEPQISLDQKDAKPQSHIDRPFYLRLGVAGFCFGNIMLFSFPEYLGISRAFEGNFITFFAWLNWALSLPVLLYSSTLFFKPAIEGLRQKNLNIDVPVSLGILALFFRSTVEIFTQSGAGYLDSLAGLVFFLLVGKWFQRKTYDTLSFDKDYSSYFPLSTTRIENGAEQSVPVTTILPGDTLLIRNQELIPADSILISGKAQIDYSFVTGESTPVPKQSGDLIYAGGRQVGTAIEVQVIKDMSHSYLTQLWKQEDGDIKAEKSIDSLADSLSKNFTLAILFIAIAAGIFWGINSGLGQAVNVFTAVLIVACPCGLALTSPIILGNSLRLFGKKGFYLKQAGIIEKLASIGHLVFDKTGTLTHKNALDQLNFEGELSPEQEKWAASLTRHSQHPVSRMIAASLPSVHLPLEAYMEIPGKGIKARVCGREIMLGSRAFLMEELSVSLPEKEGTWLGIDGDIRGRFTYQASFRPDFGPLLNDLGMDYEMSLLSGDSEKDRKFLEPYFEEKENLRFQQSPMEKESYIKYLQQKEKKVLMVGDGLNDAGALRAADVGIAISESAETFSPACDGIMEGKQVSHLKSYLDWAKKNVSLIRGGFALSLIYNSLGLTVAVMGLLTPLFAAVLMPLSSVSVVIYGMLSTWWIGRKFNIPFDKSHPRL